MRIIAKKALRDFWKVHAPAEKPLRTWYATVKAARWPSPTKVKEAFGSADFIAGNRAIFDVGGNKYRLVVKINYPRQIVFVRFVGTHKNYDRIDPETA
jgi:mRNA interferase HigB